jgi:RHS repeat-associated protein
MYDGDGDPVPLVQNASYNAAGQLTSLRRLSQPAYTTGWIQWTSNVVDTDTFSYNVLGQLIRQSSTGYSWSPDIQYNYSATANDGRILQRVDAYRAGVGMPAGPTATTNYQYDTLGRITSAVPSSSTTALNWGQSYVFDPFGNLLQKNVTQGSATAMNLTIDPATNRISAAGFAYDAAGNLTQMPTANGSQSYVYDSENRISQTVSGQPIFYGINGERIYDGDSWHYYGPGGAHMGSVRVSSPSFLDDVQFAGRPVYQKNSAVETDRLGSVVQKSVDDGVFNYTYLPYGESVALPRPAQNMPFCWPNCASSQDPIPFVAFGTYVRDGTFDPAGKGLDYARHRYYDPARGRFTTADPAASGEVSRPGSWNQYAYTEGDPVNFNDPEGLYIPNPWYQTVQKWIDVALSWSYQPSGHMTPSNVFTKAVDKLGKAVTAIEERTSVSADCDKDLAALSAAGHTDVSLDSIQRALASTNFGNGSSSTLPVSALFGPGAEAAGRAYQGQQDALYGPGQMIGNLFARNPNGLTAETVLGGRAIFINPALIGGSLGSNQSLLFHEAIHELGLVDETIQEALGLKVDSRNTKNISDKLFRDCFTGKGNKN